MATFFAVLRQEKLYASIRKYKVARTDVNVFGRTITSHGLSVDNIKTEIITKWPTPSSLQGFQSYLGLVGGYRRFIHQCKAEVCLTRHQFEFFY